MEQSDSRTGYKKSFRLKLVEFILGMTFEELLRPGLEEAMFRAYKSGFVGAMSIMGENINEPFKTKVPEPEPFN